MLASPRNLVALAETAAEVLRADISLTTNEKSGRGRPRKTDSEEKIAERIGVPQPTINVAKQHVAAVNKYPELKTIPTQKDALTIAKNLDSLSDVERGHARKKLKENDSETLTTLPVLTMLNYAHKVRETLSFTKFCAPPRATQKEPETASLRRDPYPHGEAGLRPE
ncbi:MAG: hypothetical protein H0V18_06855 [Pyrinomonadaceae bacterium]|nr:hypothetical protein [Pyrinomonadaceae bacterium]MBA3768225.1 hypothetical protein [Acidobacteriota bacterium]